VTPPVSIGTLTLNPALDESTRVPRVEPDRKLRCSSSVFHPGGGGINVARAIRNLGGRAVAVFPSGGESGRRLEDLLRAEGVDAVAVPVAGSTRENLNVTEESTGRQYRFCKPGPLLSRAELENCFEAVEALAPLDYLVLSGSLPPGVPPDFYRRAAAAARLHGTRIVLDASGDPLRFGSAAGVYLLKTSLSEFESLTGASAAGDTDRIRAARELIEQGQCEALVLTLGAQGALWVSKTECGRVPALTVPVASGVGAGDSLVAGLLLKLSGGASLREAVAFGVAAGSAAVMRTGTELCRRTDVERLWESLEPVPA
jgi:6-phosphofructokinase 2